jgi:hypothetical protein
MLLLSGRRLQPSAAAFLNMVSSSLTAARTRKINQQPRLTTTGTEQASE